MPKTRDSYLVRSSKDPELAQQLTFYLSRIADRLDKLEGIRGEFDAESDGNFEGSVTAHGIKIHDPDDDDTVLHEMTK